ncbi:hypothetical protein A7J10_03175 [Streptococcus suis]|nr:hypothetical protein A7J10_03175 [Streptococcus suis]
MSLIKAVFGGMGSSPAPLLRVRVNISAQWTVKGVYNKSPQFVFHIPNLTSTSVANFVRYISNLQRFPKPLELCGGGSKIVRWSETVWGTVSAGHLKTRK